MTHHRKNRRDIQSWTKGRRNLRLHGGGNDVNGHELIPRVVLDEEPRILEASAADGAP